MKGSIVFAAALASVASTAHGHAHRRAHDELFARGNGTYGEESCVPSCTTIYKTITGEPTLVGKPTETEDECETPETSVPAAPVPEPEQPAPEQPAPEQPAPEQPAPEQPAPEQPAPEQPAPEQPAPEQPAPEQPAPEQPAPEQPTPETPAPEEPKPEEPEPETPGDYTPPTGLGGNGADHWAITYTPYTEDESGSCKTRDQVFADVKNIKALGFNTLRIYSTDCDTLPNVGDACEAEGLKMIVGVFVKEAGCGYSGVHKEQVEELVAWGKWDLVSLCVVGNEAIFGGLCDAGQLKSLIDTSKQALKAGGYTGPVTTAETVDVWQKHGSTFCDSIDVAGANTHPYFNAGTAAADAGSFVKSQLDIVGKVCGKHAISLECGWPTEGNCNGKACPGVAEQHEAIDSIRGECGSDVVFFTYGKAYWKGDSECGCEPHFDIEGAF